MSALGQKQTFAPQKAMSALPPKADIPCGYGQPNTPLIYLKAGIAKPDIVFEIERNGLLFRGNCAGLAPGKVSGLLSLSGAD